MIILSLSWQLASQGFVLFRVLGMDTTAKKQNHVPQEFFLEMTQLHLEFQSPRRVCHTRCSLVGLDDDEYKCPYANIHAKESDKVLGAMQAIKYQVAVMFYIHTFLLQAM